MYAPRLMFLLFAVLLVPPVAADMPAFAFAAPAQVEGQLAGDGIEWALLIFHGEGGRFHVGLAPDAYYTNITGLIAGTNAAMLPPPYPTAHGDTLSDPLAATIDFRKEWSMLLVVADHIHFEAEDADASLQEAGIGAAPIQLVPRASFPQDMSRNHYVLPDQQAALGLLPADARGLPVSLKADGVRRLEWHNATVSCSSQGICPDGAGTTGPDERTLAARVRFQRYFYTEITSSNGTLEGHGNAYLAAAGGADISLAIHGSVRLPLARLTEPCDGCPDPAGGTLQATGNLTLTNLSPDQNGRLRAQVSGLSSFRIDEHGFQVPVAAVAATTGALAVAAALLARAVAALAARTKVEDALENPRRKELFDRIVAHPGLSFRDLQRQAGWGIGTMVHHLRLLVKAGHVVAQPYGHTVRYFENHGRYRTTWRTVAVLADERLGTLHGWLLEHAGASQREVVRHAHAAWGWGRSATQDRLHALVREGLASARTVGRSLVYEARPQPVA